MFLSNMKDFEQYGKMKEPARERRKKEKRENMTEKEKKEEEEKEPRGFFTRFDSKRVTIRLITGDTLEGVLSCNAYNKYDTILTNDKGDFLIPKHAVVYITLEEEEKKE